MKKLIDSVLMIEIVQYSHGDIVTDIIDVVAIGIGKGKNIALGTVIILIRIKNAMGNMNSSNSGLFQSLISLVFIC